MYDRVVRALLVLFHRLRSQGPTILVTLAALVTIVGPFAFAHEARVVGTRVSWHEALYYTICLFTIEGNRFGYPVTIPLEVLYFLAPAIATSAVLGAFIHLLAERAPLYVRRLSGHCVVGGLGNLGGTVARDLTKQGIPFVAVERDEDAAEVANLRATGDAVVLVGDMTSAEVLRRARCQYAERVFFTAPSDVVNLDAAFNVRRLAREEGVRKPPTIYAHVYDVALSDSLHAQLSARHEHDAMIVPFNSYRFAAKALLGSLLRDKLVLSLRVAPGLLLVRTPWPEGDGALSEVTGPGAIVEDRRRLLRAFRLEREDAGRSAQRFAIVGLGRFGRSVARELIDAAPVETRFLMIERSRDCYDTSAQSFTALERDRFETFIGDANSASALDRLESYRPTAVVVCTDNDISNLRLTLDLHRRNVKTVTRMFDLETSTELGRGLNERGISPVGLARLFRAAIPILTHERHLRACVNLDVHQTPNVDHLFYMARVSAEERARLGTSCVGLDEFPRDAETPAPPDDLGLVWYQDVRKLSARVDAQESPAGMRAGFSSDRTSVHPG